MKSKANDMNRKLLIISTLMFFGFMLNAQDNRLIDRSFYYPFGEKLYYEGYRLPSETDDSVKILVLFKMTNESSLFIQTEGVTQLKGKYISTPSVEIVCKDSDGIIRQRSLWRDTVFVNSFEKTISKSDYIHGALSFVIGKGKYDILLQLQEKANPAIKKVKLDISDNKDLTNMSLISDPIFYYYDIDKISSEIRPFILGGKIPFNAQNVKCLISFTAKPGAIKSLKYEFKKIKFGTDITDWPDSIDIRGNAEIIENRTIKLEANKFNKITLELAMPEKVHLSNFIQPCILTFELPESCIEPGSYQLKVYDDAGDTISKEITIFWLNQPLSLRFLDYALDMLHLVLSDEEFEDLKDSDDNKKYYKFFDYWRKQDPTPKTPFNESMSEYYKRVDYAFFNFQTLLEKDGAKTDRANVYILYGPPDSVDRKLTDSAAQEIWKYIRTKKEYIFETAPGGKLKLVNINDIP
ncbi:MAG: hypothetical protein QG635_840 [Bacteroidota bacterium]|nr:hypothetical protein [Bacteroidota bacterium]